MPNGISQANPNPCCHTNNHKLWKDHIPNGICSAKEPMPNGISSDKSYKTNIKSDKF